MSRTIIYDKRLRGHFETMDQDQTSKEQKVTFTLNTPTAIVVAGALIGLAIYASNKPATTNPTVSGANTTTTTTAQTTPAAQPTPAIATVSIDDDAVLGNPDAPITFIEFSDYECPFCKRHFQSSFTQLKKDYIDTGKVKLVYRDLPLPFHEPMATKEAMAANCAREQGNDETYYKFHDEIFIRTTSNGTGLTEDSLYAIATDLGLNKDTVKSCVDSNRFQDEITKDMNDATTSGATATPSFFVGLSTDNGTIQGKKIVGAQPYETVIKPAIEELLQQV